jgi:hypothetical protein
MRAPPSSGEGPGLAASAPVWPRGERWAKAGWQAGHFCRHESHAPSDYEDPRHPPRLTGRTCGVCCPLDRLLADRARLAKGGRL